MTGGGPSTAALRAFAQDDTAWGGYRRRAILFAASSVNQIAPSGPVTMPTGFEADVGEANSVKVPFSEIAPMRLPGSSENHTRPSGPAAAKVGPLAASGSGYCAKTMPAGEIVPMKLRLHSANQRLPSSPTAIPLGALDPPDGILNWVIAPAGVIVPITPDPVSLNQRLPFGPLTIVVGAEVADARGNSVMAFVTGEILPIFPTPASVNQTLPSGPAVMEYGSAGGRGRRNLHERSGGRIQLADFAGSEFGKPEVTVRTGRDAKRSAAAGRYRELGDRSLKRYSADSVAGELREPEIAVRRRERWTPGCSRRWEWETR